MNKSRHLNIAIKPSMYESLSELARQRDSNVSSLVRAFIKKGLRAAKRAEEKAKEQNSECA